MSNAVVAIDDAKAWQVASLVTGPSSKVTVATSFANNINAKETRATVRHRARAILCANLSTIVETKNGRRATYAPDRGNWQACPHAL